MQLSRRHFLAAASATAAFAPAVQALAQAAGSGAYDALYDAFFSQDLERYPEGATELGLDRGAHAGTKSRLGDVSAAGIAEARRVNAERIAKLKSMPRPAGGMDRVNYDTVLYVEEVTKPLLDLDIGGFDGFSPSPYVISPITGAYARVPVFLDTKHTVETAADADAYLSRLDAFAKVLDDNTDRFRHDVAQGVVPPDFLIDITLGQIGQLCVAPDKSGLVTSLGDRAEAKGLGQHYRSDAAKLYEQKVCPALERQIAALKQVRARATHDAGVWRFEKGPAFYAANLRYTTTTDMTPEEVHQLGQDQAKEIGARLDGLLKKQGLTQGGIGQRIQALYKDPKYYFPNTDPGRAELIAYLQGQLLEVKKRLPTVFDRLPNMQIEVRRVPPAIDSGAPGAYSESAPLDRSRPGYIYFNLHDTHEWPKWNLPSTLYHEGLPGHQLQGGLAQESRGIPMLRKTMYFSGYGEGWALYAEQLADEMGMYEDDPLGRIGWLKAQMFRAARCIVDTGMHTKQWSREKAIQTVIELDGDAEGFATREVQRYCAIPAQACSYKIGHTFWNRQRDKARAALGPKFDIRAFHDAGLLSGAMPLDVLAARIDDYIADAKRA